MTSKPTTDEPIDRVDKMLMDVGIVKNGHRPETSAEMRAILRPAIIQLFLEVVGSSIELPPYPEAYDLLEIGKLKAAAYHNTAGKNELKAELRNKIQELGK